MPEANHSTCRSCGAAIVWIVRPAESPSGRTRTMPCDPAVVKVITDEGHLVAGRISHFATCPQANLWRKQKTTPNVDP